MFTDRNTKSYDLKDCCTAEKKENIFRKKGKVDACMLNHIKYKDCVVFI